MSQRVIINYEGISIELQAKCDVVSHSLCKIEKELTRVQNDAGELVDESIKDYADDLLKSKKTLKDEIFSFNKELERYKAKKKVVTYAENSRLYTKQINDLKRKADELTKLANSLTGAKLDVIDQMINERLSSEGQRAYKALYDKINGIKTFNEDILSKVNAIEDIGLRESIYNNFILDENKGMMFEELLVLGEKDYNYKQDKLINESSETILDSYKKELKDNGVSVDVISEVSKGNLNEGKLNEINETVQKNIVDEKIRTETVKIIIKAIRKRGFIVDTKNNLKIDRQKNIVKLIAKRVDGKVAEFEIHLNGKFMYHFDNYEGSACKKDIEPFKNDLEKIYGLKIINEEMQWSNPDKISTKKFQYVNKNKGSN